MTPQVSHYVPEFSDDFLSLFPHRWDYLHSPHPRPGDRPDWRTETRHPLSDRLIIQGTSLLGVRFGTTTRYCLLDIDAKSPYHPRRDHYAISRMMEALEVIGLCGYVACTSSYSGGLHLYLPWSEPIETWKIAASVAHLLTQAGFAVEPGILEIYPNVRLYDPDNLTLYKGHRLPMQSGSYLVGDEGQQINSSPSVFVSRWTWCMAKNDPQPTALDKVLKAARGKHPRFSHKAHKFLKDLDADIETGWTAHGQTNFILGRITLRSYVFGHLTDGGEPREGDRLVLDIIATATQLPGYSQWCRHQHEILRRAEEWARCVENSHYWHYKVPKTEPQNSIAEGNSDQGATPGAPGGSSPNPWNAYQQQDARDRIRYSIATLLDQGQLPAGARERFILLTTRFHIGGETLYTHRDLWHPDCLWNSPPAPPTGDPLPTAAIAEGMAAGQEGSSLFVSNAGNAPVNQDYRRFVQSLTAITGGNSPTDKAFNSFERKREGNSE